MLWMLEGEEDSPISDAQAVARRMDIHEPPNIACVGFREVVDCVVDPLSRRTIRTFEVFKRGARPDNVTAHSKSAA